jgi:hypothetical protein
MKIVAAVLMVALLLIPGVALAGAAEDAALALGAFAVFNQLISGTGIFGGVAPVVAAPQPVYAPPPVVVAPRPVYVAPAPVVVAPRPVYVTPPVVVAPRPVYVHRGYGYHRPPVYHGHHVTWDRDWKHGGRHRR